MTIDSHQHFWKYDPIQYPWITDQLSRIRRDYLPLDLEAELKKAGLDGSIAVQARRTLEESRWLLDLAARHPSIKGVVGWVDLRSAKVCEELAELARHPKLVGVRHVVQDEPDDEFMLRGDFLRGVGELKAFGLTYDLLIFPRHLPAAVKVVSQFPEQKFVLDHIAKPLIKTGTLSPWKEQIHELARSENVLCKVSGMVTEAKWGEWKPQDFRPYLDVVFEAFGEDRIMFGSDWPVCLLSGSYKDVLGIVQDYLQSFSQSVREKIMGQNTSSFYGITD